MSKKEIMELVDKYAYQCVKNDDDKADKLRAAIEAALPDVPTVPEGWKLAPIEPTDAMVQAAHHLDLSYMPGQEGADRAAVYRAMLSAAPEPAQPTNRPSRQWYTDKIKETMDDDFVIGPAFAPEPEPAQAEQPRNEFECLHINQGSMDAAADMYAADYWAELAQEKYEVDARRGSAMSVSYYVRDAIFRLLATSPQTQPMSDKQIDNQADKHFLRMNNLTAYQWRTFARAVERFHKIGAKDDNSKA